jgi:glycosyltransferase involved in cell wall biosynthesis
MINDSKMKHSFYNSPTISVVTCTFNSEKYLENALLSVERQTYPFIEHIINDSFSTDNTIEILKSYINRNQNRYPIKLIQSQPLGVANALNVATECATGEIIHYLHSDDYYDNEFTLEKVAAYFRGNPDLVWLTGNFLIEYKGRKIILPNTYLLKYRPEIAISFMNFIHHENTFVKRESVINYGGFCEDKTLTVEYRLWLRLIQDHRPLVLNEQFTVFIIHKGSTSTGNIKQFLKALNRGINTLRDEKVFPIIGYYVRSSVFKYYQKLMGLISKQT